MRSLGPDRACGFLAVAGLLAEADRRACGARCWRCATRATPRPRDRVVGYGAWIWEETRWFPPGRTLGQRRPQMPARARAQTPSGWQTIRPRGRQTDCRSNRSLRLRSGGQTEFSVPRGRRRSETRSPAASRSSCAGSSRIPSTQPGCAQTGSPAGPAGTTGCGRRAEQRLRSPRHRSSRALETPPSTRRTDRG